jgi:1-acyl-sn-glycerol-3-phosphate acyltransferase
MRMKLISGTSDFSKLWLSQLVSSFGDRITQMALLSLFLISGKDNGGQVAVITFFTLLPYTLFGPLFGVLADRISRRRLMVFSDVARAGLIVIVAFAWAFTRSTDFVFPGVFLLGTLTALFSTSKIGLVTNIIPKQDLVEANSILATTATITTLVGTFFAGAIVKIAGEISGFMINGATYLLSALLLLKITAQTKKQDEPGVHSFDALLEDLSSGFNFIRRHGLVRNLIGLGCVFSVFSGFGYILILNYCSQTLHCDSQGFGLVLASMGLGMVLGGLILYKRKDKVNYDRALYVSFLIIGVFLSIFFIKPGFYATMVILFCTGVGAAILTITLDTIVHHITPDASRAKVFAARTALTNSVFLISLLIVGLLIKSIPSIVMLVILGGISLILFFAIYLPRREWMYQLIRVMACLLMRIMFKLRVSGQENIPAKKRLILAGNHTSILDGIIVACAYPRQVYFMVADFSFNVRPWGAVLSRLGYIPVHRHGFTKEAIAKAVKLLKSGHTLGIFPEGKITEDGRLEEGKRGVALIARLANADILPFAIEGAHEAWQVPKKKIRRFPIELRFSKVIDSSKFEIQEELVRELMSDISQVKLELEREGYLRVDPDEIVKHLINPG